MRGSARSTIGLVVSPSLRPEAASWVAVDTSHLSGGVLARAVNESHTDASHTKSAIDCHHR
uniref:Uncharacterized protein n=1 Tax=Arundo donax TaxID=35708 RepID=A0A0A9BPB6_ARUDO